MTSVLSSVSYWLGGTRDVSPERIPVTVTADGQILEEVPVPTDAPRESHAPSEPGQDEEAGRGQNERSSLEMDLQEVSEKAMQAAREWGSKWRFDVMALRNGGYSAYKYLVQRLGLRMGFERLQ